MVRWPHPWSFTVNSTIHDWLSGTRLPEDFYELLGKPRFDPDREQLLAAIRTTYAELLPCQNHENPRIAGRAIELQKVLGHAVDVLSDRAKLHEHNEVVLRRLRETSTQVARQSGQAWDARRLETWLIREGRVHFDRAGPVARYLLASGDETIAIDLGVGEDRPETADKVEGYVLQDEPPAPCEVLPVLPGEPPEELPFPSESEPLASVELIPEEAVAPEPAPQWPRMYGIKEPKRPSPRHQDPGLDAAFRRQKRQAEFILWMIVIGVGWLILVLFVMATLY